jgi:hypothetical protein
MRCREAADGGIPKVSIALDASRLTSSGMPTLCSRMDADNDGWIQVAYEDFMAVRFPSLDACSLLTIVA